MSGDTLKRFFRMPTSSSSSQNDNQSQDNGKRLSKVDTGHGPPYQHQQGPPGSTDDHASIYAAGLSGDLGTPNLPGSFYNDDSIGSSRGGGGYAGDDLQKVFGQLNQQLKKLKTEHANIQIDVPFPLTPGQIVWAQQRLINEYEKLGLNYHDVSVELASANAARNQLSIDHTNARRIWIEQKDREEKALRKRLEDERKAAEKALRKEFEDEKKSAFKEYQKRQDKSLEEQKAKYKGEITRLKLALDKEEAKWHAWFKPLEESLRRELSYAKQQLDNTIRIAEVEKQRLLQNAKDDLDRLEAQKDQKYHSMKAAWEEERATMISSHEFEIKSLKEQHELDKSTAVKVLEAKVEDFKVAIVDHTKKDMFKSMSDSAVASQFQAINNYIDEFARVTWDTRRESTWPFPRQAFDRSENDRQTKQYIIQNTLWVILYEMIFCTPFRMLGREGLNLEGEWTKLFGQDWTSQGGLCPGPTKDSEKWRYEHMKTCVEALNQKYSNDTKVDHEQTLKHTCDAMCQELEKVTLIQPSDRQRMTECVKKVAKLWLDVGQQRYRLFLWMSDTGKEPMRSSVVNYDGSLNLVITPGLRRIGNSQGDRLEVKETVASCHGKFATEYISK